MKICFLAPSNSIHSFKWIEYFSLKHEILWISLEPNSIGKKISNIEYVELNFSNRNFFQSIIRMRKYIKNFEPNVIHVHSVGTYGFVSLFFPKLKKMKRVLTPWGSDILLNKNNFLKILIIKYALQKAEVITSDAEHMQSEMLAIGIKKEKLNIINFGIDVDHFSHKNPDINTLDEYKIKTNENVITSLRSLDPIYDLKTLIKAIPEVISNFPNTKFLIFGDGPEKQNLMNLVEDLKIRKYIIFTGRYNNFDLPNIFSITDIYVSSSTTDAGIAASTAEAMSCEKACIISDSNENNLWIKDGHNGFLFKVGDNSSLAKKINKFLLDENIRRSFGKLAREKIINKNSYQNEMKKMDKIYRNMFN